MPTGFDFSLCGIAFNFQHSVSLHQNKSDILRNSGPRETHTCPDQYLFSKFYTIYYPTLNG